MALAASAASPSTLAGSPASDAGASGKHWNSGPAIAKSEYGWKRTLEELAEDLARAGRSLQDAKAEFQKLPEAGQTNVKGFPELVAIVAKLHGLLAGKDEDLKRAQDVYTSALTNSEASEESTEFGFVKDFVRMATLSKLKLHLPEIKACKATITLMEKMSTMATAKNIFKVAIATMLKVAKDVVSASAKEVARTAKRDETNAKIAVAEEQQRVVAASPRSAAPTPAPSNNGIWGNACIRASHPGVVALTFNEADHNELTKNLQNALPPLGRVPVIVRDAPLFAKINEHPASKKAMGTFMAEFVGSPSFKGSHGRAHKLLPDLAEPLVWMNSFAPEWDLKVRSCDLEAAISDQKLRGNCGWANIYDTSFRSGVL